MREIVAFRPLGLVLAAVMSVVSIAHPALAAPGGAAAVDETAALEAKRHYEEGTKAFNLGEFPRAISEFKAAYNAKPEPLLLYNIAQSYRLAGDPTQAVFFYKSFLRNMPAATNRKDVEGQIRRLEKQIDQAKREPAPTLLSPAPALVAPNPSVPASGPMPKPAVAAASTSEPAATPTASPAADAGKPLVGTATASSAAAKSMTGATPGPLSAPARSEPSSSAALRLDSPPPPASIDLTTPEPARPEEPRPIYKKWWFWAGAAGVIVIVGGFVAAAARKAPDTTLGNYNPMFTM